MESGDMKIEAGKIYHNGKGKYREVLEIIKKGSLKDNRYCEWEIVYQENIGRKPCKRRIGYFSFKKFAKLEWRDRGIS
jgi:hypothetical protein